MPVLTYTIPTGTNPEEFKRLTHELKRMGFSFKSETISGYRWNKTLNFWEREVDPAYCERIAGWMKEVGIKVIVQQG